MPYSITEAKNKLSRLVREAERGTPVKIMRRGELVAVIVSADACRRLTPGGVGLWEAIELWRETYRVADLDIDPEIFNVRDRSPGRVVEW
jgi:prevent-host-death family protein